MRVVFTDGDSGELAPATARECSPAAVQDTIARFNDVDRSMLTLTNTASRTSLTVCGRPDALIVCWQRDHCDTPCMTLCAERPLAESVELLCGQRGDYPGEVVVSRGEADDAIEHFIETGQMTPLHRWRSE